MLALFLISVLASILKRLEPAHMERWFIVLALSAALVLITAEKECASFRECVSLAGLLSSSSVESAAALYARVPVHREKRCCSPALRCRAH